MVVAMVVELFAVVEVADVTPALRANGEFGDVVAGDGWVVPSCVWIF